MKKTVSLFLVLVFLGPWLGLICDCCPMAQAAPASTSTFVSPDCGGCCPDEIRIRDEKLGLREALGFQSIVPATVRTIDSGETPKLVSPSARFDFVRFSVSPPLYLTLQILRI